MSLYVQTTGHGPDVVLLHGWALNSDVWETVRATLATRARVTVIDLPGYGRSAPPIGDYSLARLARQLQPHIPPGSTVLGWSLGGMVATQLALDFPRQVGKLVLVASSPQFVQDTDWPHAVRPDVLAGFAQGLVDDYRATVQRFLAIQAMGSDHAREEIRLLRDQVFQYGEPSVAALQGGLDILLRANLRPELARIVCPTLLVAGARDTLVPLAAMQAVCAQLAHCRLETLDRAGHAPFLSHPQEFLSALERFL